MTAEHFVDAWKLGKELHLFPRKGGILWEPLYSRNQLCLGQWSLLLVCQFTHVMSFLWESVLPCPNFFFFFGNRLEQSHECFKSKIDTQPLTYIESHYLRSSLIEFWAQQDIYFLKGQPCFVYWLVYLKMFTFLSHWHTQMNKNVFPGCF